jgi:RNA polymerase sigma factor (sigma-70 family)
MKPDRELLRCYLEQNSEPAFTEIVQRHLELVYSTALRRVGGDAQLAEDVAQKVFSDLARKAASLTERASLSGWLYVSTNVASAAVVRSERRRKTREAEAHLMETTTASGQSDADWTRLRPVIDDAVIKLKTEEREAIALRFFEQRSFAEVGATLSLTEDAARKRVERALDKLRAILARRGVTSTAAALAVALTTINVTSVPAALAGKIAGHALTEASVASSSVLGAIATAVFPAAALLMAGGFLIGSQRSMNSTLRAEVAQLTARNNMVAALQTEIRDLTRLAAEADNLRRIQAELPDLRSALDAQSAQSVQSTATLTVAPTGTISWGADGVKLAEFIARLKALKALDRSGESKLLIRGPGAEFSALAYVISEARKAGIEHVIVESDATPNPKLGFSWF